MGAPVARRRCGRVHQRHEPRPQRRRATGAANIAYGPPIAPDVNIIRRQRHVRHIPHRRRTLIAGHVDVRLPTGDAVHGADAPAASGAVTPVPDLLRCPNPAGPGRRQGRSPHQRHQRAVLILKDARIIRPFIARSLKERLPLDGELRVNRGVRRAVPNHPRRADLFGQVVLRNSSHDIQVVSRCIVGTFIDQHLRQARRHGNGHVNVQRHFHFPARTTGLAPKPVYQYGGERHTRQGGGRQIVGHVAGVITVTFKQRHTLARPRQRHPGRIRFPEIIAPITSRGARAGGVMVQGFAGMVPIQRPGQHIIVQPADGLDGQALLHGGFDIRRIKLTRFIRVLIGQQPHVEGPLDVRHAAPYIHQRPVAPGVDHRQSMGQGKGHHRLVILFGGTELFSELPGGEVMAIVGAGRVVELLEQVGERVGVSQRQSDGQVKLVGLRQPSQRLQARGNGRHVAGQDPQRCGHGRRG